MPRSDLSRMQKAFATSMRYRFARVILGYGAADAHAFTSYISRATFQAQQNASRRRRYARYRASGLSYYQTLAKMAGVSEQAARAQAIEAQCHVRQRWGGQPGHVGSQAWLRRLVA